MGRGRIEENTSRPVTFCSDLLKKEHAAVLCKVVALFSRLGRPHERANNSDKKMAMMLIVAVIFLGTYLAPVSSTTATSWEHFCAGGNFTPSSTYARSLDKIAAELPKSAARSPLLFAGVHSGEIHEVAECRRDSTASACERCTATCLRDARNLLCPFRYGAVVFSEICSVTYYVKELLQFPTGNELDKTASKSDLSPLILHSATFSTSVGELAKAVARRTAISPAHFGTGQKEVVQEQYRLTVYGLAQCLPSLSVEDCEQCLADLLDAIEIAIDMTEGRVARVWCNYRFALQKFFRGKPALDLPAKGLPKKRGRKKHHKEDNKHNTSIWPALVAVLSILLVVSLVAWIVTWRRNRNQQKKSSGKEVQCTEKALELQPVPCRSALEAFNEIIELANNKEIAVFLDYDGTLTPIVNDPEKAFMSSEMRDVVQSVADNFKTSIVSGRERTKAFSFVQISTINYAGSHGNNIKMASTTQGATTSGEINEGQDSYEPVKEWEPVMKEVYNSLVRATQDIDGATVENKESCVSVHYRNVAKEDQPRVLHVVEEVLKNFSSSLNLTNGHMVYEVLAPGAMNKGGAVCYILDNLGLDNNTAAFAIYIGDDLSDENAFKVIRDKKIGVGIVVSETSSDTSAFYSLKDPPQVMEFLKLLVKWKVENIK